MDRKDCDDRGRSRSPYEGAARYAGSGRAMMRVVCAKCGWRVFIACTEMGAETNGCLKNDATVM